MIWADENTFVETMELMRVLCNYSFIADEIITAYCTFFKKRQTEQPETYEQSVFCDANFEVCITLPLL